MRKKGPLPFGGSRPRPASRRGQARFVDRRQCREVEPAVQGGQADVAEIAARGVVEAGRQGVGGEGTAGARAEGLGEGGGEGPGAASSAGMFQRADVVCGATNGASSAPGRCRPVSRPVAGRRRRTGRRVRPVPIGRYACGDGRARCRGGGRARGDRRRPPGPPPRGPGTRRGPRRFRPRPRRRRTGRSRPACRVRYRRPHSRRVRGLVRRRPG